ncbi:hypothetical protein PENTCL1PPCAC_29102, partial [Pristionchus entomophagus]
RNSTAAVTAVTAASDSAAAAANTALSTAPSAAEMAIVAKSADDSAAAAASAATSASDSSAAAAAAANSAALAAASVSTALQTSTISAINTPTLLSSLAQYIGAAVVTAPKLAPNALPDKIDRDWWNMKYGPECPRGIDRTDGPDNRNSRMRMYKKHVYGVYYALVRGHRTPLEKWLSTHFGDSAAGCRILIVKS